VTALIPLIEDNQNNGHIIAGVSFTNRIMSKMLKEEATKLRQHSKQSRKYNDKQHYLTAPLSVAVFFHSIFNKRNNFFRGIHIKQTITSQQQELILVSQSNCLRKYL
jgi:hypothetical protein